MIFMGKELGAFDSTLVQFISTLPGHIEKSGKRYLEQGYLIAISNCIALLGYNSDSNPLNKAMKAAIALPNAPNLENALLLEGAGSEAVKANQQTPSNAVILARGVEPTQIIQDDAVGLFVHGLDLFINTIQVHLDRVDDFNTLGFVHVTLIFTRYLVIVDCLEDVQARFPWQKLVALLNNLLTIARPDDFDTIEGDRVPRWGAPMTAPPEEELKSGFQIPQKPEAHGVELKPTNNVFRPFPEEWALQGLEFASRYFEDDWFKNPNIESEEHYLETESMRVQDRPWRVLWLGVQIAKVGEGRWITYDYEGKTFSTPWGRVEPEQADITMREMSSDITDSDTTMSSGTVAEPEDKPRQMSLTAVTDSSIEKI
jgi:hypothetical protein